jgi:SAM-dependent methyltransferase
MTSDVNSPSKWELDYARGTDGWDLGGPAPALRRLAAAHELAPGRMLVLGAGRGHDAREFARHGFQVTAVDFSEYAVAEMRRLADPEAPIEILHHDLFALPGEFHHSFDYVLEHTCYCAIDPRRRAEYAALVASLLKPGGTYIDLAFPVDARAGGPPFAVSLPELFNLLGAHGFTLLRQETPSESAPRRRGLEQLLIFRAPAAAST